MRMVSTGHQLGWTCTDSLRDPAVQEAAAVQEELQQVLVRAAEPPSWRRSVKPLRSLAFRLSTRALLRGFCAIARVGDRVVAIQTLPRNVEQVNAPGIGSALFGGGQPIAVGRPGVDTGQYGLGTLKDFVVQAEPD